MSATAIHTYDAVAAGLLPPGWQEEVEQLAHSGELLVLEEHPHDPVAGLGPWTFSVLPAEQTSLRLDWLWRLYHGVFRDFASQAFNQPLFPANRRSATITLNRLAGSGATNGWHRDANPVTGVFYASTLSAEEGGQLELRGDDGAMTSQEVRAGSFVCFAGPCEHRTVPLLTADVRLAVAMTYYTSIADQPFASEGDRYEV